MFESIKIINECKKILKKHNIKYNNEYMLFKKHGIIHCQVMDWRGPVEIEGFPVLTIKKAIENLLNACASDHYIDEEKSKRELLMKSYPLRYGDYESRKYYFEGVLKVVKDLGEKEYNNAINKYTKYINMNRKNKQKWTFNKLTEMFEIYPTITYSAVVINKVNSTVRIYNQEPCGGKLDDNIYKIIAEEKKKDLFEFTFTNNGIDRYYLRAYNPNRADSSENYIMIYNADKVEWVYSSTPTDNNLQTKTFIYDGILLNISGEIRIK